MTFWGKEREISLRSHVPAQGRRTRIYLAMLPEGVRTKPAEQTLIANGRTCSVTIQTISSSTTAVSITVNTPAETFSVSVNSATDTVGSVARRLMATINNSAQYRAVNYRKTGASNNERTFNLISPVDFAPVTTSPSTDIVASSVSGATTAISKGATSIPLPIPSKGTIPAGSWLQFVDPNGMEYLAKLSITASNNSTTLTVDPLEVAIPAGSTCIYPPEFSDRREASLSESFESVGFRTFNTGGFEDAIFTGASAEFSLGGLYNEFDAAYRTVVQNAQAGREFFVVVEYGNKREGFTRPRKETIIMFTSLETPLVVDGLIEASFSAKVLEPPITVLSQLED